MCETERGRKREEEKERTGEREREQKGKERGRTMKKQNTPEHARTHEHGTDGQTGPKNTQRREDLKNGRQE